MRTRIFLCLSKWKTPTEETRCRGSKAAGFQLPLALLLLVVAAPLAPAAAHYQPLLLLGISDGMVYKLWPPETPDMLSSIPVANGVQVSLAGMATNQYRLFRSTDPTHWSVLTNILMPHRPPTPI